MSEPVPTAGNTPEPWMREAAKGILHAGSWPDEWESEDVDAIAGIISLEAPVQIDFDDSPCGHSSQYAYTSDGGKTIICLLCERVAASSKEATPEPWIKLPDEQTWWWHWNGEDYAVPHIYSVMYSGTSSRYFIAFPDSRWCDELGGWWLKIPRPNVPSREWQKSGAEATPSPATTKQWATFYRCGKNMGNDLLVIPCDLEKDHDGPCERNIWPVPAEPNATPRWERQQFCPECDGDGCNLCGQQIAYWKTRAETAELKVLTFNEEIAKLRTDAPSPAREETLKSLVQQFFDKDLTFETLAAKSYDAGARSVVVAPQTHKLNHGRNCPELNSMSEDACTCGLEWRIALQTEQTMHAAWRKRAEESERESLKLKRTVEWIAGQTDLFFAECSQAEEIVARCKEALAGVASLPSTPTETKLSLNLISEIIHSMFLSDLIMQRLRERAVPSSEETKES